MPIEANIISIGKKIYNKINKNNRGPISSKSYFGKLIHSNQSGNDVITEYLKNTTPFVVSRLGHVELSCLINYHEIQELKQDSYPSKIWNQVKGKSTVWEPNILTAMQRNAGFFPVTPDNLQKFSEHYIDKMRHVDIMAVWFNYYEDIICNKYCKDAILIRLASIEPYYFEDPWSKYLKRKKVLVIHPFEKSIQRQYEKREWLFENKDILPDFELKTIKAVQTNAYNNTGFSTWFEALESMKQQMQQTDFDVALIGAGAYGLPLAVYAKELGKQAIHFGGSLQILFGIKGSRWDSMPDINKYYNEHWIRPLREETPTSFKAVEDGCYW